MKNNIIYFLSCLVLAIGLESCSSDDSNDNALLLSVSIVMVKNKMLHLENLSPWRRKWKW